MATVIASQPVAATNTLSPYRFSVEQYHRMIETGILKSGAKVHLLEGLVVNKMTIHPPHSFVVTRIDRVLARLLAEWVVRTQQPITTADSEPEPDVVIVPGPDELYANTHPTPPNIALVIEVSDTSLEQDRGIQKRIYAHAKIPVYWVVNIPEGQIEVYTRPRGGKEPTYRDRRDYPRGETIPLVLAGREVSSVPVLQLLPLLPRPESQP
jgi:Uma2 family endonuclease